VSLFVYCNVLFELLALSDIRARRLSISLETKISLQISCMLSGKVSASVVAYDEIVG